MYWKPCARAVGIIVRVVLSAAKPFLEQFKYKAMLHNDKFEALEGKQDYKELAATLGEYEKSNSLVYAM